LSFVADFSDTAFFILRNFFYPPPQEQIHQPLSSELIEISCAVPDTFPRKKALLKLWSVGWNLRNL